MKSKKPNPTKAAQASASTRKSKASPTWPTAQAKAASGALPARSKTAARESAALLRSLTIPPILFEGDSAPAPRLSGPGQRYELAPTPPSPVAATAARPLAEVSHAGQLHVIARDPHSLHVHWNLSREQQRTLSGSQRLGLRILENAPSSVVFQEVAVQPEARACFVPVPEAGKAYVVELGRHGPDQKWVPLAAASLAQTPPEKPAENGKVRFTTLPLDQPLRLPAREASAESGATTAESPPPDWPPEQERALAKIIQQDLARCRQVGSLEIAELLRRKAPAAKPLPRAPGGPQAKAAEQAGPSVSSADAPFGEAGRPRGFWLNVNAELIIYGATEAEAAVTIGGRAVVLRPDGTFSARFALPDGIFELPVTAVSVDGQDERRAEFGFSRATRYAGPVEAQPPTAPLPPPF